MRNYLMNAISVFCFWFLKKHFPDRIESLIRERSRSIAQDTAMKVSMEFLHKQGFLTCASCPQRFGLQYADVDIEGRTKRVMLCTTHYRIALSKPNQLSEARA